MKSLVFSLRSIYHLQKVAQRVHATTGQRFQLSEQASLVNMLATACKSKDASVQGFLTSFAGQLDKATLRELSRRGIQLSAPSRHAA